MPGPEYEGKEPQAYLKLQPTIAKESSPSGRIASPARMMDQGRRDAEG